MLRASRALLRGQRESSGSPCSPPSTALLVPADSSSTLRVRVVYGSCVALADGMLCSAKWWDANAPMRATLHTILYVDEVSAARFCELVRQRIRELDQLPSRAICE